MALSQAIRAGAAFVELYIRDNRLVRGLANAAKRLRAFGAAVRQIGREFMTAGAAIIVPLLGAAKLFASVGDQLDKMRVRTGMSAQTLSELGYAADVSGVSLEQLDRGLTGMSRFAAALEAGSTEARDALRDLGISAEDFMRAVPEKRFKLIADGISRMDDASRRAVTAMQIFGRSGYELLPMLAGGSAAIEAMQQEARELGITLTDEDVTAAAAMNDAMYRLRRQLRAVIEQIGTAFASAILTLQKRVAPLLVSFIRWIRANKGLVVSVFTLASATFALGLALAIVGAVISGIGKVFAVLRGSIVLAGIALGLLMKLFGLLLNPTTLVIAAIVALAVSLLYLSGVGRTVLAWLSERFKTLASDAKDAWHGIADALASGNIGLAAKILWLTLKMEWKRGIHFLNGLWVGAKKFFMSLWTDAVYAVASRLINAWAKLQTAWGETVRGFSDIWSAFVNELSQTWYNVVGFIKKAWLRLKALFQEDIDIQSETERINRETAEAAAAAEKRFQEEVAKREQERQKQLLQIENDRVSAQQALTQMKQEEEARRNRAFEADLAATERELADARREWQQAIADAARARRETAAPEDTWRQAEIPQGVKITIAAQAARTFSATGTFNPFAIAGMGADTLAERTAKASEQIAINTQEILEELQERGPLVFAQ